MNEINHGDKPFLADDKKDGLGLTLEKKEKAPLTDEQLAVKEANRQKAAIYKERRIALGLSQKQLAQKTGVSYNSIQGMETGKSWPRWETRQKIRHVLGMPEERLYSIRERNAVFLELQAQDTIEWIVRENLSTLKAMGAIPYLEDFRQDLALCAIRAIDRFQAYGGALLKPFVKKSIKFFAKNWIAKFSMHGVSGEIKYPLPKICVLSLDALMESGFDIAG